MQSTTTTNNPTNVDLLCLGYGWTGSFLFPLLKNQYPQLNAIATTRDGNNNTLKWNYDNSNSDNHQFKLLPKSKTVVIIFPLKGSGDPKRVVEGYESIHGPTRWIQLGSTGIFDGGPTLAPNDLKSKQSSSSFEWTDRFSPYALDNQRAIAEDELLSLRADSFVLNLCGLWGGERDPINWLPRIAPTKEALATKTSVHLIHGLDVARGIIAVHLSPRLNQAPLAPESAMDLLAIKEELKEKKLLGKRYIMTDLRVYCWFDLISAWGLAPPGSLSAKYSPGEEGASLLGDQAKWVLELMEERGIRALPRTPEQLGRAIDSRDFWNDFGLMPVKGRLERGRL